MRKLAHACLSASLAFSILATIAATTGAPENCPRGGCEVTVSVNGNSCGGGIAVSIDPIIVTAVPEAKDPVTIKWKVTGGWQFTDKGIEIFNGGDFVKATAASDKSEFTAKNAAKVKGTFKYDINLVRKAGAKTEFCSLDPTIVNK